MNDGDLILCHLEGMLAAWYCSPAGIPQVLHIEGERELTLNDSEALQNALHDIASRCRESELHWARLHWVADAKGRMLLSRPIPELIGLLDGPHPCTCWQVLAWELLAAWLGLPETGTWTERGRLERELIPWLVHRNKTRTLERAKTEIERQQIAKDFEAERTRLETEIARLRHQRDALRRADLERLASYLPALYQNFFEAISPTDLALQCGHIIAPDIPSPYPEPAPETLRRLQRDFRALPPDTQREIVGFARRLAQAQRLRPRPEMSELIDHLVETLQ